jgi:hypothetical protein
MRRARCGHGNLGVGSNTLPFPEGHPGREHRPPRTHRAGTRRNGSPPAGDNEMLYPLTKYRVRRQSSDNHELTLLKEGESDDDTSADTVSALVSQPHSTLDVEVPPPTPATPLSVAANRTGRSAGGSASPRSCTPRSGTTSATPRWRTTSGDSSGSPGWRTPNSSFWRRGSSWRRG